MKPDRIKSVNLDANETAAFQRELTYVKTQTYDRKYPEMGIFSGHFPIGYSVPSHVDTIEVRSFDQTGVAKIIADFSDDLPRTDVVAKSDTIPIRTLADSYGYSIDEIRKSAKLGTRLDQRKATAAKRAIMQLMNEIGFKAQPATHNKLTGLFYYPGIPSSVIADNAAGTSTKWVDKTPDEVLVDLNLMAHAGRKLTNGIETPDTMLLPMDAYAHIATTPRSSNTDTTILEFFLKSNKFIKTVDTMIELHAVTPRPSGLGGASGIALVFKNDEEKFAFEIPSNFEQLPAQERGLEQVVPCMAKTAGFAVYYPLSITIWEGLE